MASQKTAAIAEQTEALAPTKNLFQCACDLGLLRLRFSTLFGLMQDQLIEMDTSSEEQERLQGIFFTLVDCAERYVSDMAAELEEIHQIVKAQEGGA